MAPKPVCTLFGYLLCFTTWRQIGVLSPRAAKVRFWAPKLTVRAKAYSWPQECFLAQKLLLGPKGDFGWFGWEMDQFGVGIHMVSSILRILVFPWCQKWFLWTSTNFMLFYDESIFYVIYDFCNMSWNLTSIFCHPSNAFPPPFERKCWFSEGGAF